MSARHSHSQTPTAIGRRPNRKTLQLCGQVKDALTWVLGSGPDEEALALCYIEAVEPLPGGNRMLVRVATPQDVSLAAATERLAIALPRLRAEVARAITRRKAPELVVLAVRFPTRTTI